MTTTDQAGTAHELNAAVSIRPTVGILGVFRHLNYEPWFALAEFVDNAIQSAERSRHELLRVNPEYKLKIDIQYESNDGGRIVIVDNAGGIARSDFPRAFRAAEVPPDRTGLSEFGMGMKSAAVWFARNWRVVTTSVGDPHQYVVEFDMPAVVDSERASLPVMASPVSVDSHFTRIELWNLNQFLRTRTLGKVRTHLAEIYREYLRSGRLDLTVHGQVLRYEDPEFLCAPDYRSDSTVDSEPVAVEWRKDIDLTLESGARVWGWAGLRREGKTSGNGITLLRRGRVITGTAESPYRPKSIYGGSNSFRSQRLFAELHVEGFEVSHTKDGIQWKGQDEEFEALLRDALDAEPLPLIRQADNYRAKAGTREDARRVKAALANTAEVTARDLPGFLREEGVSLEGDEAEALLDEFDGVEHEESSSQHSGSTLASESFGFNLEEWYWRVELEAGSRPELAEWMTDIPNVNHQESTVDLKIFINLEHPVLRQFALGSDDAVELASRMAVALAVTKLLFRLSGDGDLAASMTRKVNSVLSAVLAHRAKGS